ncbi:MAG: hypothetical protein PUD63_01185 [Clostridia bacterium]|nr:hypothetical protein [Clostridia bacterium]
MIRHHEQHSDEHHGDAQRLSPGKAFAKKQKPENSRPQRADALVGIGKAKRQLPEYLLPQNGVDHQRQHLQPQKQQGQRPVFLAHPKAGQLGKNAGNRIQQQGAVQ